MPIASEVALPTLLCSRPNVATAPSKARRPIPVALDALDDIAGAPISPLRIKNTFLDGGVQLSPSLDRFYQAREVQTCPSKHAGRIVDLLEKIRGDIPEEPTSPTATPLAIITPCSIQTPVAEGVPQVPGYQWCGLSFECQSYGHASQMSAPTEAPFGGIAVAQYNHMTPPDSTALLYEQGNYAPRAVLNLADALESEAMSVQQVSTRPEIQPMPYADAQFAPLVHQPDSAAVDGWTLNLGTPSNPPPPPAEPAVGTAELPSMGSSDHALGCCKPCAFLHTKGCQSGLACKFCHLCGPEERRRRRQEKQHERRELHKSKRDKKKTPAAIAQ